MAIDYKIGDKLYLPVTVINGASQLYPIKVEFFCDIDTVDNAAIANKPDLLLTASEIAANIAGRRCAECSPMYEELKARNAELEALLKEVTATRDEAIRQINELLAENSKLKAGADKLKDTLVDRTKDVQHYKEENKDLKRTLEIVEAARDGAIDESLERKNRVTTMEEVIVALVEKIRRLKGGET